MKKILYLVLSFAMLLALLLTVGHAADAATMPRYLYVGGVTVVEEYVAGAVTSGEGWRYDVDTATLYLTDGADIRYTSTTEECLENGLYCSNGTLKVHASGTVSITGYGDGIRLPDGTLELYAAEGSNITITGTYAGSEGISSTVKTNSIRISGKGTVNVNASDGAAYGMTAAGNIYIDGVTLNVRGTSNYNDISGSSYILIGQTEGAVVNCLGTTCSGIGGGQTQKIGIYNGSTVHLVEKVTDKSWLTGMSAKTMEIVDSTLVMDGITGTYSIYAMHGASTVSGASHILIRKMVSTEDGAYGLTVGYSPYELTGAAGYYTRSDAAAEFIADGDITEIYVGYFELYYPSHLTYHPNGDGTHYLGCPTVCDSGIRGESKACGGTANCTTRAFCQICQSSYGEPDPQIHDSSVTLVNGFCPYCPAVEAAVDSDGDDYYEIGNGGQLYWFAQQVNGGDSAINGKLTADIVVNENVLNDIGMPDLYESTFREWVPIGSRDTEQYTGNFDGQGHTVSGLFLNDYVDEDVGLFGAINGATIKNVGLVDSWISAVYNVAGIAGYATESTLQNCYNTSTINGIGQSGTGASSVGGITGYFTDNSVMINCYNTGRIIGDWWVGGLSGRMYARNGRIQNCYNVGSVEGTKSVGGLIGEAYGIVTNCYNIGSVDGSECVAELIAENIYNGNVTNCYYLAGSNHVGIAYDVASKKSLISTFTVEQFAAASGETGAVVDVLNAWVAEQNDETYMGWHICADISYYYPALNRDVSYVNNGETHTVQCVSCDAEFSESHVYSYTVEENRITETCQRCSYSASVSLEVPEESVYHRSAREASYIIETTTPNSGILLQYLRCSEDPEAEPELLASAPADAGTYIVRLSVGEASVEGTMTIVPRPITLLGAEAESRDYDGTPYVTLDASRGTSGFKVEGILDGDSIEILCTCVELASADAGTYHWVTVKGLSVGGEDGHNYTVVSEASLPIYNIWGNYESDVLIYQKSLTIRLSDQQAASLEELDQNGWEIDEDLPLLEGHSIASIKLVAELNPGSTQYASISVEEGSLKIVDAAGNDVTGNYIVWAYPATLTITCSDHDEFVQGFCTNCGGYEEATFNEEGYYYEIANAGQLYWFAEYVNNVDGSPAAVLVSDIVIPETAPEWTPIGSLSPVYSGSFDGQGHTISGLYVNQPEWDYVGLFGNVSYNPEVKNLTIINSTFIGNHYVGALAGYGEFTASNIAIGENVTVQGSAYVGTMVGYNLGEIRNCYAYSDSFVGYMYSGYGSIENCYFLSETDDEYGAIGKTAAQFASGEVAYLLQAGVTEEDIYDEDWNWIGSYIPEIWGQTIGTNDYPVLGGAKVYEFTNCKNEIAYSNSSTASGHNYVNGICGTCGAADPDYVKPVVKPNLTLSYPTLNFKDVVYYNVYFQTSDMTDVVEMGLITFDGALSAGTVNDATAVIPGYVVSGSNYMVHTNGINAKNLGDALYFKVYAKLSDGSYVYSSLAGYHAVAYAKDILANSTNAKMKSLVVAMLNYGAAAQVQFEYKTDSLMNSFLTEEQKALVADYSADMVAPVTKVDSSKIGAFGYVAGGYSALYPSVSFEGAFSVKFYFTPAKAMDGDLTMYYWSAADYAAANVLTAENATGVFTMDAISGTYVATVEGIAACQIDETIYVAGIYESDGVSYPTGVIAYSLGAYCLDRVANGTGNMPAFAKATIVYGNYAKAYFA